MLIVGIIYMVCFFTFRNEFEKVNDTLCLILTIISVICIIWGFGLLIFKTP